VLDHALLFSRVLAEVDDEAYFTPMKRVSAEERFVLEPIRQALESGDFIVADVRAQARALYDQRRIDRVKYLSCLHMIAAHPRVAEWDEAARLAGEQELAALELGGPELPANLASVDRHRGVLAFLRGHYEVALDYFSRAIERERTAENLGQIDEAGELLLQIRCCYPPAIVRALNEMILSDADLALLRLEPLP
jgi:tetratricopeptide (TPR) repeat protein